MSSNTIKKALKNFGLTKKESEIYIFLAKHGVLTGGEISKLTKTHRPHTYRILKSLQKKGVVESTLESPVRFSSVPFEKVLDENIKFKQQEATSLEKSKSSLLADWNKIYRLRIEPDIGKFVIIEGNRKIYAKIAQLIKETRRQFSAILTVTGLVRTEQFGVFDAIYSHPLKSNIQFQFLTELSDQNLKAIRLLKTKLKPGFDLKGRNPSSSFALLPKMVIRDNKEVLFFISPKSDIFGTELDDACIYTDNSSLVQALTGIFKDLWQDSADIEKKIAEIKTGWLPPKRISTQPAATTSDYNNAFVQVKKHALQYPLLASQLERIEYSQPSLVGREKELAQLEEKAVKALKGNGNTVLISGEAGIGKTRLAKELASYAKSKDFKVLECQCLHESALPLWPIRKVLQDLFNISNQDVAEVRKNKIGKMIEESVPEFLQLVPLIDNVVGGLTAIPSSFSEDELKMDASRLKLLFESAEEFVAVSNFLASLSKKQPIMLFVDDLHLADSSTLKLFQDLAKAAQESRFLLVGSYRQEALAEIAEEANPPFLHFVERTRSDVICEKIELKRLTKDESSVLINNVLGIFDDLLAKKVHAETEGNPFFILETLRFLINKRLLKKEADEWKLSKDIDDIQIPPKIHDVISRRINILKEEERDILDCAAVVGEEFSSDMIEAISGLNRLKLLKKLNNVERKFQLIHSSDALYRFDHAKIREILYHKMSPELRREYHSLIAKQLEKKFKDDLNGVLDQLAYHYYKSENALKAVPYLLEAGEISRRKWAIFETIRYYLQALKLMGDYEKWRKLRTEIFESLGSLYALAAEHELSNEYYEKGIATTEDETIKNRMRRKIRRKKIVEKDGTKLAYYVYGDGEPTIFLLAWTATAELWIPQITYFSQKCKVVTMDMRGTGESDKPPSEYSVDMFVDDLKSVIDDLQDKSIVFVGSFVGGKIAIKYITSYPGKISKLVLLSTHPGPASARPGFDEKKIEENHERMLKSPTLAVKRFWEQLVPEPRFKPLIEWGLKSSEKTPPEIFVKSLYNFSKEDVRPLLGKIDVPTLIINGDKTPYACRNAKYLEEKIPKSKAFIFKDLGLCFLNMKAAAKFNEILESFIDCG
jgi:pimeloyl-ACP methyl ester carboxylesterase